MKHLCVVAAHIEKSVCFSDGAVCHYKECVIINSYSYDSFE